MAGARSGAVGAHAETYAFNYLRNQGLTPVARNFRTRRGEIDLVMRDRDCLTFIEVRYRGGKSFVDALLTVDSRKQRKLAVAASAFLAQHPSWQGCRCRFDVVGVDRGRDEKVTIDWMKDAFRPGM